MAQVSVVEAGKFAPYTVEVDEEGDVLAQLQGLVGGHIEVVQPHGIPRIMNKVVLVVDEEGVLKDLPFNALAADMAGQPIVGTALVLNVGVLK